MNAPISYLTSKPYYEILDGLRGVAALLVVLFHFFEAHASRPAEQLINHGYLAVDFFFVLSGFVIGYAYDDRWHKMTLGNFSNVASSGYIRWLLWECLSEPCSIFSVAKQFWPMLV